MACNAQRIRRGTTPMHKFTLPFEVECVEELAIIYKQGGRQVLRRTQDNCEMENTHITTQLTQEETFAFVAGQAAEIQVRVLTQGGDVLGSEIIRVPVLPCLEDEVLA